MCGIAGILHFDEAPVRADLLERMAERLAHRGPDAEGTYVHGSVGLAHRRLAILDPSEAGRQPMANEDQSIWITYNGEIYNFGELRDELAARGHRFRSRTDTEVVLHAYEEWGLDCLARFNGMFAFGLWDDRRKRLWLARDRIGIKPLFYHAQARFLLFGSEIKCLLCDPRVQRTIDHRALAYYVALNWMPAPHTMFSAVRQLLPGHYLLVERDGRLRDVEYWDLQFEESKGRADRRRQTERLAEHLSSSVRLRLVSDVPFGAFLSGGLDSSSVCYWMSRHLREPVKTFSLAHAEPSYNETPYARQVARRIRSCHRDITVRADAARDLPKLVWHAEEPTADSSMLGVYYLAEAASESVKMVLSGDGADEILAGYETYQAYGLTRLYRLLPGWLRRGAIRALVNRTPVTHRKVDLGFKLRRFAAGAECPPEDAHAVWREVFDAESRHRLLEPVWHEPDVRADMMELYRSYFARCPARQPLNRMLYVDTRLYLPNDMLVKVDRMTMAHGLEARVPFLDHRLVEFCAGVPPSLKLKGGRVKKYLLRRTMRGRLPASILRRKKMGFNQPVPHWISNEMKPFVRDTLSPRAVKDIGLLSPAAVTRTLEDHFRRRADNSHQVWCLLTLMLWYNRFILGAAQAG